MRTPIKLGYGVNLAMVQHNKKLKVLNPSRSQVTKDAKSKSFVKEKRPELFPVKDEHKNPCSYLGSGQSFLKKRNVSDQVFIPLGIIKIDIFTDIYYFI